MHHNTIARRVFASSTINRIKIDINVNLKIRKQILLTSCVNSQLLVAETEDAEGSELCLGFSTFKNTFMPPS